MLTYTLNTLLEASSAFLHTPLMVFIGFISYLAYKGFQSSNQADYIRHLERKCREMRAELIKNNHYVDGVVLERAELKDELKECHQRERDYELKITQLKFELEEVMNDYQQAQDHIKELEEIKPNVIGECEFQSMIEEAIIDYIERSDIGWTLATEIADKFDLELDAGS